MSQAPRDRRRRELKKQAPIFAALGDETRLQLLAKLSKVAGASISQLAEDAPLTRQAITKHLQVLERAGLVRGVRQGRENRFEIAPQPLVDAIRFLEQVSEQWGNALARLKSFVEE